MAANNENNGSKILLLVLGAVANLLLGFITLYVSILSTDIGQIEAIARTGAANSTLLAKDVDILTKWTVEEIRELKERIRAVERGSKP